jgi:3-hydroxyacyl-CoA dehydrogenase
VVELPEEKRRVFGRLDEVTREDVVLASNVLDPDRGDRRRDEAPDRVLGCTSSIRRP